MLAGKRSLVFVGISLTSAVANATCTISSAADIPYCSAQINSGVESTIIISGTINCASALADCSIRVANQNNRVINIQGNGINSSAITRTGAVAACDGAVSVSNSSNVNITNFRVNEVGSGCDVGETISIISSNEVDIGNMYLDSPRAFGVAMSSSSNVIVYGSTIVNAGKYGIVAVTSSPRNSNISYVANTIFGSCDAAVDSDADYAYIQYNVIYDNHENVCFRGLGGGQIAVEASSYYAKVDHNNIYSTNSTGVEGGIELAPDVQTVEIAYNSLINNKNFGIVWDNPHPSRPWGNIWIHNNQINGANPYLQLDDSSVVKDTPCSDTSCL